jgi:hypothetical protein
MQLPFVKLKTVFVAAIICTSVLFSCKKQNLAPTDMLNDMVDTTATLQFAGNFISGPYGTVMGTAQVYRQNNMYQVKLDSFSSSNGPALHVYLSKEAMPVNYYDLGELRSTNGSQVYDVSGMPDFIEYRFISIHCVDYNHLFGYAEIQ